MIEEIRVEATERWGEVAGILNDPGDPFAGLAFAHGAGAGIRHPFMESMAACLADAGVASLRYHFPYMERGRRAPDARGTLLETVRSAVAEARRRFAGPGGSGSGAAHASVPLLAGGKSMGGRMTSTAAAEAPLEGVSGLVFLGFPLHPPGRPSTGRGDHLFEVELPMLFLQGTRDRLADLDLLEPVCRQLGDRATLHVVEDADHSFHMTRRSGRTDGEVQDELARVVAGWAAGL